MPPSHFAPPAQPTESQRASVTTYQPPPPHMQWINQAITRTPPEDPNIVNPWLAITQTQQDVFELKEKQKILTLQGNGRRGNTSADHPSDVRTRYLHCFLFLNMQ